MESVIMINLWHPCYEIDTTEGSTDREVCILENQGYIDLNEIRRLVQIGQQYDPLKPPKGK